MSLFCINNLRTLKHLTSLTRPSNLSKKPGVTSAPCSKYSSQGNDGKQQNDSQQQNDQQQNQGQMQMQMQQPQPSFNQQGYPQQQWCPCCCQPTACYIPPGAQNMSALNPACNPFSCGGSPQMQMQMSNPMNAQMSNPMNAQMSSQQYPQHSQFMPMQAHCLPQWNPPMEPGASVYPCPLPVQESTMCSTFCPDCRSPCGPNEQCPRCQAKRMSAEEASEQQRSEEKPERSNMSSGSAYSDLFEKKKTPSKTDN